MTDKSVLHHPQELQLLGNLPATALQQAGVGVSELSEQCVLTLSKRF